MLPFYELCLELENLDQWMEWHKVNPWAFDRKYITNVAQTIGRYGVVDPEFGLLPPYEIAINGENYRETLMARGLNSRLRAVMAHVVDIALEHGRNLRVYAPESLSPFAERLRRLFLRFSGSEYLPDDGARSSLPVHLQSIEHQDVELLTYSDSTFDLYVSAEILEHLPSVQLALNEARRILRLGGTFICTFPFNYMSEFSVEKNLIENGNIVHLTEPEYHGNPLSSDKGSLVFTIPGWDILSQCKAAGFSRAMFVFRSSRRLGIIGKELAGVFVLIARA